MVEECECLEVVRRMLIGDAKFLGKRGYRKTAKDLLDTAEMLIDKAYSVKCIPLAERTSKMDALDRIKTELELWGAS